MISRIIGRRDEMTKYLETKRNSIEEAISSVVLGEDGFVVGKVKMQDKGGAKLQSKTNFDFRCLTQRTRWF